MLVAGKDGGPGAIGELLATLKLFAGVGTVAAGLAESPAVGACAGHAGARGAVSTPQVE